jgi:hypothetical protein
VDSRIHSGFDIEIGSAAERCELQAGQRVLLLGSPGLLLGGEVRSGRAVEARLVRACGEARCRIHVGDNPFAPDRSELADRLAFALSRIEKARRSLAGFDFRGSRSLTDIATYRQLAKRLVRRLRQYDSAEGFGGESYVEIGTVEPEQAEVTFGRDGESVPLPRPAFDGAFAAMMRGGNVVVSRIEEEHCVG